MLIFLIINLFSSFFLCGLIWTIQLVHYPSFHALDKVHFIEHMNLHKQRISLLVVPMMLLELATSIGLVLFADLYSELNKAGLIIVILIWFSTFFVQVPLHKKLSSGYDQVIITKLVRTNFIRTILWTLKATIGGYVVIQLIKDSPLTF